MGCCDSPAKVKQYPQVSPSGGTVNLRFTEGGGPFSLRGPITRTQYRISSDGLLRPAVYIEDAQVILTYGGKFKEV